MKVAELITELGKYPLTAEVELGITYPTINTKCSTVIKIKQYGNVVLLTTHNKDLMEDVPC